MRSAYKYLAHTIAGFVAFQAAVMVFAVSGLVVWIDEGKGHALTKSTMESEPDFTGAIGFMLHGMVGMMLIPLLALVLLIISFFAKTPGGVKWAAIVLGLVVLQVFLGIFGHETPYAGLLHGLNALILFSVALVAGRSVAPTTAGVARPHEDAAVR
jgi:heme A synthase